MVLFYAATTWISISISYALKLPLIFINNLFWITKDEFIFWKILSNRLRHKYKFIYEQINQKHTRRHPHTKFPFQKALLIYERLMSGDYWSNGSACIGSFSWGGSFVFQTRSRVCRSQVEYFSAGDQYALFLFVQKRFIRWSNPMKLLYPIYVRQLIYLLDRLILN